MTVKPTDPEPVRPVPFWKVRKLLPRGRAPGTAACVVTVMVPVVPAAGALKLVGLIV